MVEVQLSQRQLVDDPTKTRDCGAGGNLPPFLSFTRVGNKLSQSPAQNQAQLDPANHLTLKAEGQGTGS